jgi:F-type H+-transporting ATPase subunit b
MEALQEGLLKLDPGLLLWTIITFVILVLILWKVAWNPIINMLDARAEKIRGDIDKAEKFRVESEQLIQKHKEIVSRADEENIRIIADGKAIAEKVRVEILEKTSHEADEIAERSKREILAAKKKALNELKQEVVNISTEIASKIIMKNLNAEDQKNLINDTLNKLDVMH